jgi:hypothetical protein
MLVANESLDRSDPTVDPSVIGNRALDGVSIFF